MALSTPSRLTPADRSRLEGCPACRSGPASGACEWCGGGAGLEAFARAVAEPPLLGADVALRSCRDCGTQLAAVACEASSRCPFCRSSRVEELAESGLRHRPSARVPFRVDRGAARASVERWLARRWLVGTGLRRRPELTTLHAVFVPYWVFSARGRTEWEVRGLDGRLRASGSQAREWPGLIAGASAGVLPDVLDGIGALEPGDFEECSEQDLRGCRVELPSTEPEQAWARVLDFLGADLGGSVEAVAPLEDEELVGSTRAEDVRTRLVLYPIWIASLRTGERRWQVVVDARRGRVSGRLPSSPGRIAGLAAAAALGPIVAALLSVA